MDFISKAGLKSPLYFVIIKKVLRNGGEQYEIITKCKSGGGHSQLTCGEKAVSQVVYGNVIAHLLRNITNGSPDVRRVRGQAVIGEQNSRKTNFLPYIGKVRMGFKYSALNSLLPTLSPSLIREGKNNFLKRTYSPIHLFSYSLHKKAAFTLAEVLITLGIIGVVAASGCSYDDAVSYRKSSEKST